MSSVGCATACAALNSSQCGASRRTTRSTTPPLTWTISRTARKCSQETVVSDDYMSYWYECSGNGTAGGGASGRRRRRRLQLPRPRRRRGRRPDDGGDVALGPEHLRPRAGLRARTRRRRGRGGTRSCRAAARARRRRPGQRRRLAIGSASRWPGPRRSAWRGTTPRCGPRRLKRLAAVLIVLAGKLVGYVAGLLAGAGVLGTMGVAGLPKFSMEAPGTAKILAALGGPQTRAQAVRVHAGAQGGVLRAPPRRGGQAGDDR